MSQNYGTIESFLIKKLEREQNTDKKRKLRIEIDSNWILLKINIKTDKNDRKQILKKLNRMNINHSTLFPDIEGASLYANMQGDIPHY